MGHRRFLPQAHQFRKQRKNFNGRPEHEKASQPLTGVQILESVIDPIKIEELQEEVVVTLCLLEKYFPPAFFDVMLHLVVHLPREIKLCGPVWLRWMYPLERYMKILKGYVRNRSRPEGCIIECYVVEEAVEFCSEYLESAQTIGIPKSLESRQNVRMGFKVTPVDEHGFTLVDLNKEGDCSDQFIMANQAKQVFYVSNQNDGRWSVVLTAKPKLYDGGDVCDNIEETPSFINQLPELEMMNSRKKHQQIQSKNKHSHYLGRAGYIGKEQEMKEKLTLPGPLRTIYHIARAKKSGKQLYSFDLPHSLLGYEMTLIIDVDDVLQFCTLTQISANCITAYMR
ncbi:hypothetical protein UlMin_000843 [Ulmus minor]